MIPCLHRELSTILTHRISIHKSSLPPGGPCPVYRKKKDFSPLKCIHVYPNQAYFRLLHLFHHHRYVLALHLPQAPHRSQVAQVAPVALIFNEQSNYIICPPGATVSMVQDMK